MLNTVGCPELSSPSLTTGLPTSTVRASAALAMGAVVALGSGDGTVLATGTGGWGVAVAGSVGLVTGGGVVLVPSLVLVIDRLIKKIGMTRKIVAAAAEPNARPQGELKIPRSGFCCGGSVLSG
jgi:hypothetical protein